MSYSYTVWRECRDGSECIEVYDVDTCEVTYQAVKARFNELCNPGESEQVAIIDDFGLTIEHWTAECVSSSR